MLATAGLASAVVASLSGCSTTLPAAVVQAGVPPAAVVPLDDELAVAARSSGRHVQVVAFRRDGTGWTGSVIAGSSVEQGADHSVQLFGWEGADDERWPTFAYGTAPESVSRVVLDGLTGEGGLVIGGAWVVALRAEGLTPDDLHWRFVDAAGAVVTTGTGIR